MKIHLLVLSFAALVLFHPTSALCVKRKASVLQFDPSIAHPGALPVTQPVTPAPAQSDQPPKSQPFNPPQAQQGEPPQTDLTKPLQAQAQQVQEPQTQQTTPLPDKPVEPPQAQPTAPSSEKPVEPPQTQPAEPEPAQEAEKSAQSTPNELHDEPARPTEPLPAEPFESPDGPVPSDPTKPPAEPAPLDSPDGPAKPTTALPAAPFESPDGSVQPAPFESPDGPATLELPDGPAKPDSLEPPGEPALPIPGKETAAAAAADDPKAEAAAAPSNGKPSKAVEELCRKTEEPEACISLVPPSTKPDPASFLRAFVMIGKEKAKAAKDDSKKKAGGWPLHQMETNTLDVCHESYDDTIGDFDRALAAMDAHDGPTMMIMLSGAMTGVDTCGTGFAELPGIASPMASHDAQLLKITRICLSLGDMIK